MYAGSIPTLASIYISACERIVRGRFCWCQSDFSGLGYFAAELAKVSLDTSAVMHGREADQAVEAHSFFTEA